MRLLPCLTIQYTDYDNDDNNRVKYNFWRKLIPSRSFVFWLDGENQAYMYIRWWRVAGRRKIGRENISPSHYYNNIFWIIYNKKRTRVLKKRNLMFKTAKIYTRILLSLFLSLYVRLCDETILYARMINSNWLLCLYILFWFLLYAL